MPRALCVLTGRLRYRLPADADRTKNNNKTLCEENEQNNVALVSFRAASNNRSESFEAKNLVGYAALTQVLF